MSSIIWITCFQKMYRIQQSWAPQWVWYERMKVCTKLVFRIPQMSEDFVSRMRAYYLKILFFLFENKPRVFLWEKVLPNERLRKLILHVSIQATTTHLRRNMTSANAAVCVQWKHRISVSVVLERTLEIVFIFTRQE